MTDNDERVARAQARLMAAANRLAKWRAFFAGWQLGTRSDSDGPCRAVRDHREVTMLMRAELSGLTRILLDKGVVSEVELAEVFAEEYDELAKLYAAKYDGVSATEAGLTLDMPRAGETMRRLGFPP